MAVTHAGTGASSTRHITLDALRGFGVMGILLMNIIGFAMPEMAYMTPVVFGGTAPADIAAWTLSYIFVDGKMRGIFTILFGASLILITERAEARGESAAGTHYSRMFWLGLFGLAHFFLLWFGDILFLYAACGCAAFLMRGWDADVLIRRAILFYGIGFAAFALSLGALFTLQYAAGQPGADPQVIQEYQDTVSEFAANPDAAAEEIALYQGGFVEIVRTKFQEDWYAPLILLGFNFFETIPFMMIGMALYKTGFMTGQQDRADYRRMGIKFTAIGAAILVCIATVVIASDFDPLIVMNANLAWSMPSRLLMTVGYTALLIILIQRLRHSELMHRIAAAGRAAFTNYLGTSIAMTFIFYGWGLGLYGQVGRVELYLFVPGVWALMLLWSKPWLQRFRYGPFEWLWRSLSRREIQSLRIKP